MPECKLETDETTEAVVQRLHDSSKGFQETATLYRNYTNTYNWKSGNLAKYLNKSPEVRFGINKETEMEMAYKTDHKVDNKTGSNMHSKNLGSKDLEAPPKFDIAKTATTVISQ